MKKICLLAIVSFFSALAFSQNVATAKNLPGQPKAGVANPTPATGTPSFTNASGTGKATTSVTQAQAAKYRAFAKKPAPTTKIKPKTQN